ncbi:MAG: hypothetical protein H6818_04520 [Phycisphaerales bacterium]|nr:hypothetical protein [Phycisphaerales bacterium]
MFPTIENELICERLLGWNLIDREHDLWRLPDGTPRISTDSDATQVIESALADALDVELTEAAASAGWLNRAADSGAGESQPAEEEWVANYPLECAIARATRRLIDQRKKTRN